MCTDEPPPGNYSCQQQAVAWGKVGASWYPLLSVRGHEDTHTHTHTQRERERERERERKRERLQVDVRVPMKITIHFRYRAGCHHVH